MTTTSLLLLLASLLALSAIISASETAFFSLRPWRIERLRRERPGPGRIIADALPVRFQVQMHKIIWPPEQRGV